jgi:acetolactate synthase I/II/III large subunit
MGDVMTGARAVIKCLENEQVEHVFCVPGESYLPVLDELYEHPSIQLISARHEGGASFMAEGYAKAKNRPGIVMATRAVGGANLSIGVHTAFQDSTPMIVFLGQVHRDFRGREGFQEVELERYFSHIAKWTVEVDQAKRMPELIQRAFRVAMSGRPGPVVVALPEDVLIETAEMVFGPPSTVVSPGPSEQGVEAFLEVLQKAERPVVIAGGGVRRSEAEEELVRFAEAFHVPVLASFRRHDVFPNNHPLYSGHLGLGTAPVILETVRKADVVISIGSRLSEVTSQDYSLIVAHHQLIHVDISPDTIGKVFSPSLGMVSDAKAFLQVVNAHPNVHSPLREAWCQVCRDRYVTASTLPEKGNTQSEHMDLKEVISVLQEHAGTQSTLTNDAGNFAGWLHKYFQFNEKGSYIGPTSGAMGYGMPAALGAKLASPDKLVISLSGDGGMMMTLQELETAVRYKIPIIAIVVNNHMYGTIRMHQERHYPERVVGTMLNDVDFAAIAKGFGCQAYVVKETDQFRPTFEKALKDLEFGPVLIEVKQDPEDISVSTTLSQMKK